jgi:hypothetical protein
MKRTILMAYRKIPIKSSFGEIAAALWLSSKFSGHASNCDRMPAPPPARRAFVSAAALVFSRRSGYGPRLISVTSIV